MYKENGAVVKLNFATAPFFLKKSGVKNRKCGNHIDMAMKRKYSKSVGIKRKGMHMKISTKGRYALRLMLDLAANDTGTPISVKDIAERQGISDKYLEQIIAMLNKAGFVKSIRGAQGGYMLNKSPSEYTVGMILRLAEGSLAPVSCLEGDVTCERLGKCGTAALWKRMHDAVNGVIDTTTLQDLLDWQQDGDSLNL